MEIEIDTSFGYPLLRHQDDEGTRTWYYPATPNGFGRKPKLIRGIPTIHIHDGFRITVFTESGPGFIIPIVLSVTKVNKSREFTD